MAHLELVEAKWGKKARDTLAKFNIPADHIRKDHLKDDIRVAMTALLLANKVDEEAWSAAYNITNSTYNPDKHKGSNEIHNLDDIKRQALSDLLDM